MWKNRLGRALMALIVGLTIAAFVDVIRRMGIAATDPIWIETWRTFAYMMFAGLFALLALRSLAELGGMAYTGPSREGFSMTEQRWIPGRSPSAAVYHLFVFGRLGPRLPTSTRSFPNFHRHTMAVAGLEATQRAIA